jgi:DNA (cytosine-5)-methyltransferase 1
VAGVRKGLSGERSGLFHEAIRIIKEMRDATNGQYPRVAIWENVPGALTSNKGADFGVVLDEMAESGCVALDWAILDAQYYGIAQRRRRIFVCATYDIGAAERSPIPLLPVQEGVRRHSQKGRQEKQKASGKASSSIRSSSEQGVLAYENSGFAKWQETDTALTLRARDAKGPGTILTESIETRTDSYQDVIGTLQARDWRGVGTQYVAEDKLIVEDNQVFSFDTQFGSNANVFTDHSPTLKATQQSPSVAYEDENSPIVFHPHRQDGVRLQGDTINTLTAFMGTGGLNTPMVAQMEELNDGVAMTLRSGGDGGVPSSRGENLVIDAIAYDEYNDKLVDGGIHHAIRAGTKQSTGVLQNMVVRRLLPKECEILMGWPVDHTRWRADGKEQPDTARYKQTGNGVAAPVAEWLGKIFKGLLND